MEEFDKKFLEDLLNTPSPSGYEGFGGTEVFKKFCRNIPGVKEEFTDTMGNCAFSVGEGDISIMISGHIDEIGLQATMITDDGLINITSLGGIDKKCLLGQEVEILSSITGKIISGVIGKKPIHIEYDEDEYDKSLYKYKDILVDIGAENKDEAKKLVSIGDPIVIKRNCSLEFGGNPNRIMSKGLDDKIGVYISAMILKEIASHPRKGAKVWCTSMVQEEVGLRGAIRAAKEINPTYSIDIDVTFATDEGRGVEKELYGDIKLGKGPVIMHGPDKSAMIIRTIKRIAKDHEIKYQEAVAGAGGTNTAAIQEASLNTETIHIAIPQRNMHTPVEICDWRDVKEAVKLISLLIYEL